MKKAIVGIVIVVAGVVGLWAVTQKQQPQPAEPATVIAEVEELTPEPEPSVPEPPEPAQGGAAGPEGGAITGRVYDADTGGVSKVSHWGFWMADSKRLFISKHKEKIGKNTLYAHFTWDVLSNTAAEDGGEFLFTRGTKCAREPFGGTMAYITPEEGLKIIDLYGQVLKSIPGIKPPKKLFWLSNPPNETKRLRGRIYLKKEKR